MNRFSYVRATDVDGAVREKNTAGARFIAGGTNLVDLMKYDVERPAPARRRHASAGAAHRECAGRWVTHRGARHQRRHLPTTRGSPCATRCSPTRSSRALRLSCATQRPPAAISCSARAAIIFTTLRHRATSATQAPAARRSAASTAIHAVLGASEKCIATHPSDMCVAMAALEARVNVAGPDGERTIPIADFHRLPGNHPEVDTTLKPDELIVSVDLPNEDFSENFTYLKLRDRASYAFALVSVAAGLKLEEWQDCCRAPSLWAGWPRSRGAMSKRSAPSSDRRRVTRRFAAFADAVLAEAKPQSQNALQDPAGETRARPGAAAGRRRHAADRRRQDHPVRNAR